MGGNISDSSFVISTGPPQQGKRQRISHVRSYIRKSRLEQERQLARLTTRPPERPLRQELDLSWLPVSDAVRFRLSTFLRHYVEASAQIHPFFYSVIPAADFHVPLMSAKLLNASAWDDLNTNCEIGSLTFFQRNIAEGIMSDCLADSGMANCDANLLALLTLLVFELINDDPEAYTRHKRNLHQLISMRGGMDKVGFDGNLKASVLLMDYLERAVTSSFVKDTITWEHIQTELILPRPFDLRLFTIHPYEQGAQPGPITSNLLSDFYQIVTFSIRCHSLPSVPAYKQQMLPYWHALRDRIFTFMSDPTYHETKLDEVLLKALLLFISREPDVEARHRQITEFRALLCEFGIEIYTGPLQGALIWCLTVGARHTSPGNVRKWFMMQLMRLACPLALDYYGDVSNNLQLILAGLDSVGYLGCL